MTHVFHRHTHSNLPFAVSGDGAYIVDQTGKNYLDALGGTVDGKQGNHVLLAPPYTVSENQLSDIVGRLAVSIDTTLKHLTHDQPVHSKLRL